MERSADDVLIEIAEHAMAAAMECADLAARKRLTAIAVECLDMVERHRRWNVNAIPVTRIAS